MTDALAAAESSSRDGGAPARCPICGAAGTRIVASNTLNGGEPCPVHECVGCRHKFCAPLPSRAVMLSWYSGIGYFEKDRVHQGITSLDASPAWRNFIGARQKAFNAHIAPKFEPGAKLRIAEIGCLEGAFLKALADQGHAVVGFETNAEVAAAAKSAYGIDIRACDIETEEPELQVDAILSFHTFEHLRDPLKVCDKAYRMLRPGGVMLLELPCDDDEMNNPDHLHFFSASSLRRMAKTFFQDVEIVPASYKRAGLYDLGSLYAVGWKQPALGPRIAHRLRKAIAAIRPRR